MTLGARLFDTAGLTLQLLRVLACVSRSRPDRVYDLLSDRHVMGDRSLYINLGYWKSATTLDEASEDLARLLADRAGLAADQDVLDVGFGFADQDILWAQEHPGIRITGLNVSPVQVGIAHGRVERLGLAREIHLVEGSATAIPFPDRSFDRVVALESAFHFRSRQQFFAESFRVLRPGGVIALADFIAASRTNSLRWRQRVAHVAGVWSWQIPAGNLVSSNRYVADLQAAGFEDVSIESIGREVFKPFEAWQRRRFDSPECRRRFHPLIRRMAMFQIDWGFLDTLDYVIAAGRKRG